MSIFFQMRRRFICVQTQWNWSIVKCWFTVLQKHIYVKKNIKLLAIFIATSWKYTYKSYFYRNRIIVIQIRIKHTGTKIRVASNVHKYLITTTHRIGHLIWICGIFIGWRPIASVSTASFCVFKFFHIPYR